MEILRVALVGIALCLILNHTEKLQDWIYYLRGD